MNSLIPMVPGAHHTAFDPLPNNLTSSSNSATAGHDGVHDVRRIGRGGPRFTASGLSCPTKSSGKCQVDPGIGAGVQTSQ